MSEEPTLPDPSRRPADAAVEGALERLADLSRLPPAERVGAYDEVYRRLADALADPDAGVPG